MTIATVIEQFPDEDTARRWLESVRWPVGRVCGHCGSPHTNTVNPTHPMPYWCATCRQYFSLKTGTALQRSKLPLRAWVLTIFVMTMHRTEEASLPVICQTLAVSRRTARSMIRRIRRGHHLSLGLHQPAARGLGHVPSGRKEDARRGRAEAVAEKRSGPGESGRAGHGDYGGVSGQTVGALSPGGRRGVDGHDLPAGRSRARDPNVDARDLTATPRLFPSCLGARASCPLVFFFAGWKPALPGGLDALFCLLHRGLSRFPLMGRTHPGLRPPLQGGDRRTAQRHFLIPSLEGCRAAAGWVLFFTPPGSRQKLPPGRRRACPARLECAIVAFHVRSDCV